MFALLMVSGFIGDFHGLELAEDRCANDGRVTKPNKFIFWQEAMGQNRIGKLTDFVSVPILDKRWFRV